MEATKQIVVPEGMQKKEWFNVKEFATGVGMTPHAVNQWIHRHPEFSRVWRKINEYVGRGGVAFYEFADYQKALKFTKNLFEEAGMSWD